jgi:hypothetical protein
MTQAQQIYIKTPAREFALNYKNYAPETIQELNLIHRIQINLFHQYYYNKKPTDWWVQEGKAMAEKRYQVLIQEYETKYGKYELTKSIF